MNFSFKKDIKIKGSGLLEIVIVVSLITLVISACVGAVNLYVTLSLKNTDSIKVGYLLEEGIEAVKIIRDNDYTTYITPLTASSTYYLLMNNTAWVATTTPVLINNMFVRTISFSNVYRNSDDDIITSGSGGTLDSGTKLLTVTVSWRDAVSKATTSKSISTYITNLFDS